MIPAIMKHLGSNYLMVLLEGVSANSNRKIRYAACTFYHGFIKIYNRKIASEAICFLVEVGMEYKNE